MIYCTPKITHYFGFDLENSRDCIVYGVAKSRTWLSDFRFHFESVNLGDNNTILTGVRFSFSHSIFLGVCLPSMWKHKYYSWAPASRLVPCYVSHLQLIGIWFVGKLSVFQPCSSEHSHTYHVSVLCAGFGTGMSVAQACPARLLCPWGFSRHEYWSGFPCLPPGDLPHPGIKPRSPTLQVDSYASEPPGKPKNTGVGSLFLLQGIFPTQESNRGLLHFRQILYQMSYLGRPYHLVFKYKHSSGLCSYVSRSWIACSMDI